MNDLAESIEDERAAMPDMLSVSFAGNANDYFGIWFANMFLNIATLGIWSAWAKVRRVRYFYGNTKLDGHGFDYLATGGMLLKGRLVAFAFLVGLSLLESINPAMQGLTSFILLPLYPWVIQRSLRFNARMTVWRNVRFAWRGTYGQSVMAFLVWPLIGFVSLGLLAPVAIRAARLYIAENYDFGKANFAAVAGYSSFYWAMFLSILLGAAVIVIGVGVLSLPFLESIGLADENVVAVVAGYGGAPIVLIVFVITGAFFNAMARNIVVNGLTLDDRHQFHSDVSAPKFAWIAFSNLFATILTLGLLRPWAACRSWRYQAECLTVLPAGDLSGFIDDQRQAGGTIGEEYSDLADMDVSI